MLTKDLEIGSPVYYCVYDDSKECLFRFGEGIVTDKREREKYISYFDHGRESEEITPNEYIITYVIEGKEYQSYVNKDSDSTSMYASEGNLYIFSNKGAMFEFMNDRLKNSYTYVETELMKYNNLSTKYRKALNELNNLQYGQQ